VPQGGGQISPSLRDADAMHTKARAEQAVGRSGMRLVGGCTGELGAAGRELDRCRCIDCVGSAWCC
jgi:hypothetical protein